LRSIGAASRSKRFIPGSLPADQVMAITAYILKRNGLPAGTTVLDASTAPKLTIPAAAK